MKYEELLKLKEEDDKLQASARIILEGIGENLRSFLKGFEINVVSLVFTFEIADQKLSVHPQETGLQTEFILRVAPHTEDPKKFGVIRVALLDTGTKKYVKGSVIPRGNKAVEDETMLSRLIEYFQGELGVFDAEVLK